MSAGGTAHPRVLAAIGLLLLSSLCFSSSDAASKVAILAGVPLMLGVWSRYICHALSATAAVLPTHGLKMLRTRRPGLQCLRGLLLTGSTGFVFASLRYLPVGEFTAIIMISPLLVTLLGATLLKERVAPLRWALLAVGFAGTLVIMRPGGGDYGWAMLLPLGQVLCNTAFQVLTSHLARTEHPLTMHLYTGWVGTVATSLALPFAWMPIPSAWLWAVLIGLGLVASLGHYLLILAFRRAPASTLMPYSYAQIAFAMLAGWVSFGHVPDHLSILGMALIAASGVAGAWLSLHERRRLAAPRAAPTPTPTA